MSRVRAPLFAIVALALPASCAKPDPLPKYWAVPPFALTERSGQPFDSASLKGKVWVADFFFASCPGVCPVLTARMAVIHKSFAGDDRVRFVSISTDPAHDTPAVLQEYATRFGADARWAFLTGDKSAIWQLSREGFKLVIADAPGEKEPITHSTRLVLVDRDGNARGFYEGAGGEGTDQIEKDIRRLLAE